MKKFSPGEAAIVESILDLDGWGVLQDKLLEERTRILEALAKHNMPMEDTEYYRGQLSALQTLSTKRIREALGGSDATR